jgi:hypothetical protein
MPEALACALEVIEAPNYTLASTTSIMSNDLTFSTEHIFAIYRFDLEDVYKNIFANGSLYRGSSFDVGEIGGIGQLYTASPVDIRAPGNRSWWQIVSPSFSNESRVVTNRYSSASNPRNRIPLIRLAEMYLIAAEAEENYEEGRTYLERLRDSRNAATPEILSREQLISYIKTEYRREFYAEGLVWYVLKRFNSPIADFIWVDDASYVPNYVIPLPDTEPMLPVEPDDTEVDE